MSHHGFMPDPESAADCTDEIRHIITPLRSSHRTSGSLARRIRKNTDPARFQAPTLLHEGSMSGTVPQNWS